jgi:hypothetical protein
MIESYLQALWDLRSDFEALLEDGAASQDGGKIQMKKNT